MAITKKRLAVLASALALMTAGCATDTPASVSYTHLATRTLRRTR